jgi:hypothetical protein
MPKAHMTVQHAETKHSQCFIETTLQNLFFERRQECLYTSGAYSGANSISDQVRIAKNSAYVNFGAAATSPRAPGSGDGVYGVPEMLSRETSIPASGRGSELLSAKDPEAGRSSDIPDPDHVDASP